MERPTSDKILFINSDILIHLMPSKCGILNLGISHRIALNLLDYSSTKRSSTEYISTLLLLLTRYFPNALPTYLGVLCGCVVCGCLFVWLCGSWLCVWWHHCGRAIVVHCVPAPCVARADNRGGGGIGPYPASEEIDRRPLVISCCQSVKTAVESAAALSGRDKLWQLQNGVNYFHRQS